MGGRKWEAKRKGRLRNSDGRQFAQSAWEQKCDEKKDKIVERAI